MVSSSAATGAPDPDAVEFVRFCYRRRRVGWPELYDEMCGVAGRGLFRGLDADDLAGLGIGFSLFDMPALSVLAAQVIAEEQARRRPVTVTLVPDLPTPAPAPSPEANAEAALETPASGTPSPALARAVAVEPPQPRIETATGDSGERPSQVPIRIALAATSGA